MGLDISIERVRKEVFEANHRLEDFGDRLAPHGSNVRIFTKPPPWLMPDVYDAYYYRKQEIIVDSVLFLVEDYHYFGGSGGDYELSMELLLKIKDFKPDVTEMGCLPSDPDEELKYWENFLTHVDEMIAALEKSDEFVYVFWWVP